jgi:predicted TIM-barrel enzyme
VRKNTFIVVVHAVSEEQALRNVAIAKHAEADGVFLINHQISSRSLIQIYESVRFTFGDWWVGLNLLDLSPIEAMKIVPFDAHALWVDDGGIHPVVNGVNTKGAQLMKHELDLKRERGFKGLLFGGVNFKHQAIVSSDYLAALHAKKYMDVVTTSGPRTGCAPSPEKLLEMRRALGESGLLALASGTTANNVSRFVDDVDYFLVNTGVSQSFTELDPSEVQKFSSFMRR